MNNLSQALRRALVAHVSEAPPREIFALAGMICESEKAPAYDAGSTTGQSRFIVNGAVARDTTTSLTWTRGNVSKERLKWSDAEAACRSCAVGGFTDWRLPTIRELLSLVDYKRSEPAIDTSVFECENSWYWTSTPLESAPADYAWYVLFDYGYAFCDNRSNDGFVRAVRGGQF